MTQTQTAIGRVVSLIDANKAKAAFLAPVIAALAAAVGSWIITGNFDATEIRTAAGGAIGGAISGVATWLASAGRAEVTLEPGAVERV